LVYDEKEGEEGGEIKQKERKKREREREREREEGTTDKLLFWETD